MALPMCQSSNRVWITRVQRQARPSQTPLSAHGRCRLSFRATPAMSRMRPWHPVGHEAFQERGGGAKDPAGRPPVFLTCPSANRSGVGYSAPKGIRHAPSPRSSRSLKNTFGQRVRHCRTPPRDSCPPARLMIALRSAWQGRIMARGSNRSAALMQHVRTAPSALTGHRC